MTTPATAERAAELLAAYGKIHQQVIEAAADRSETDKVSSLFSEVILMADGVCGIASIGRGVEIEAEFGYSCVASSGRHSFRGELRPGIGRQSAGGTCIVSQGGEGQVLTLQTQLPSSIQWHFIGALQSNKCKALAGQSLATFLMYRADRPPVQSYSEPLRSRNIVLIKIRRSPRKDPRWPLSTTHDPSERLHPTQHLARRIESRSLDPSRTHHPRNANPPILSSSPSVWSHDDRLRICFGRFGSRQS